MKLDSKLNNKLQIIVDIYLENIDSLNFFFLEKEDSYRLTISEQEQIIKYCKNKINTAKILGKIYRISGVLFSVFCLILTYSLLEKVIDNNWVRYAISFTGFWIVNGFFSRKFWRVGKDETSYEILLIFFSRG